MVQDQFYRFYNRNILRSGLFGTPGMILNEKAKEQEQKPTKRVKKTNTLEYVIFSLLSVFAASLVTIIFWNSNSSDLADDIIIIGTENPLDLQEVTSNYSCSFWHIIGDEYCDDEANIVDCGYDFEDCCDMESDRTLCTDCLCYVPEEEIIMLEEEYEKNCQKFEVLHLGDGLCDLLNNDKENYFDVGDCCLENPICMSSLITLMCPENVCIESNIFCIPEELFFLVLQFGLYFDSSNNILSFFLVFKIFFELFFVFNCEVFIP